MHPPYTIDFDKILVFSRHLHYRLYHKSRVFHNFFHILRFSSWWGRGRGKDPPEAGFPPPRRGPLRCCRLLRAPPSFRSAYLEKRFFLSGFWDRFTTRGCLRQLSGEGCRSMGGPLSPGPPLQPAARSREPRKVHRAPWPHLAPGGAVPGVKGRPERGPQSSNIACIPRQL